MKKNDLNLKRLIICIISIIIFVYIFNLTLTSNNILDNIVITPKKTMVSVFKIITRLGDWYTLILITLLSLFLKNKKCFKYISINLISVTLINQFLKIIIRRPRPVFGHIDAIGYSFPSGHAMVSMAFYGFLIYLILKSNLNNKIKIISTIILFIIILLIGISRAYLKVHYLTDVIAGFSLALLYLSIYTLIIKSKGDLYEK